MSIRKNVSLALFGMVSLASTGVFADESKWYVRSHIGYSQVSDQSASVSDFSSGVSLLEAGIDAGLVSGLGVGYQLSPNWATELGWEYRTNDAEVTVSTGDVFSDGNYASNVFYLNGIYSFSKNNGWQPYVGAGLLWVQEIDIDLERAGTERSFSADGDLGFQAFAGVNRYLSENWVLQGELRYGSISSIDLEEEGGTGRLDGFDYNPLTFQIGLAYRF